MRVRLIGDPQLLNVAAIERFDALNDLALLHVPDLTAPALELAVGVTPVVGDAIYAVGSPLGVEGTFAPGMVSGLRGEGRMALIQITAPVSPGSSGGPLLDVQGRVLGVIVGTIAEGQNLNFAIPTTTVTSWLREPTTRPPTALLPQRDVPSAPQPVPPVGGRDEGVGAAPGSAPPASPDTAPEARAEVAAPAPPSTPFRQTLERRMAVVVDNHHGQPQYGVNSASQTHEMPIERGFTRLLLVFDRTDPELVGPVHSARDYMVDLSRSMDAVMVNDGGSPGALAAISATAAPTLDAFKREELFGHSPGEPSDGLFARGDALRAEVNRIGLGRGRTVAGVIYRPDVDADDATDVRVRFGVEYESAFRYETAINAYRWIRNGVPASDALDQAVLVDAVLVVSIEARAIPNDSEGRLYMPLRGGSATLLIRGKAVMGMWSLDSGHGVRFYTYQGDVDLDPFKLWLVYAPNYDAVELR